MTSPRARRRTGGDGQGRGSKHAEDGVEGATPTPSTAIPTGHGPRLPRGRSAKDWAAKEVAPVVRERRRRLCEERDVGVVLAEGIRHGPNPNGLYRDDP